MKFLKLFPFFLVIIIASVFFRYSLAAVTLIYFEALPADQQVKIRWGTATELNTAGFYVQRSTDQVNYVRLHSSRIPAQGSSVTGWEYEFTDSGLTNGQTYWYKLEEIESNGNSILNGPISAVPCNPCLPTPTKTATMTRTSAHTPTRTPTPTRTTASSGSSPRRTSTPASVSPYPGPLSSGAQSTVAVGGNAGAFPESPGDQTSPEISPPEEQTSADQGNATATLIPFPSITMIFPSTPTPVQMAAVAGQDPPSSEAPRSGWSSPQRLAIIGIILAIWAILGGWFFFSFRRLD